MPKHPGTARVPKGTPTPKAGRRFVHLRVPLEVLQDVAAGFNLGAGYALRTVENKPTTAKPTTPDEAENGEPEVTPTEQIVRPRILGVSATNPTPRAVAQIPPGISILLGGVEDQTAESREATAEKAGRALLQFLKYVTGRALSERVIQCKKCQRWFAAEKPPATFCPACRRKSWPRARRREAGHSQYRKA